MIRSELRDEIAKIVDNELSGYGSFSIAVGTADRILAITHLKEALDLYEAHTRSASSRV